MNFQWQHYPANFKRLFKLSIPIFISQLAASGMGLADIIMAGLVSTDDVSAIAVSNSIYFPLFLLVLGVLNAITPTVSYLNGAGQRSLIAHQVRQGVWIVFLLSIPLISIYLNSHLILNFMQTPESFSIKAQHYLQAVSFGVIPALLAVNLRCLNDGLSNPKPAMVITFIGLILNIPLNYIFIFGKLGMPELGAVGCGVATAIINWAMFLMLLYYSKTNQRQKDIRLFDKWLESPNWATLSKLFKLGAPIGFAIFTEVMLFSASSLIISPLGSQVVASHQIALQTSSVFFMIPMSFGIATTILIGQSLGEKSLKGAESLSFHAIFTSIWVAVLMALIIIALRHIIPFAFTDDLDAIHIASMLLIFAAVYQIPDAVQAVCNGILRGYKHTKPVMFTTIICYWLIGMPVGTILARTDWLTNKPMAASGFWLMFCISLTIAATMLLVAMRKIQKQPEEKLLAYLEKVK